MLDLEVDSKLTGIEHPGKVGQLQTALAHRTGHSEAGGQHVDRLPEGLLAFLQECFDYLHQAWEIPGMKLVVVHGQQLSVFKLAQDEIDLGAAHIPCQNHRAISNRPGPSAPSGGKAAAAAASSRRVMRRLAGLISCDGNDSGSYGPVKTCFRAATLSTPSMRKKTSRPRLMTGQVSVTRHVSFCCGT